MRQKTKLAAAGLSLLLSASTLFSEAKANSVGRIAHKVGKVIVIATIEIPIMIALLPGNLLVCYPYGLDNKKVRKQYEQMVKDSDE